MLVTSLPVSALSRSLSLAASCRRLTVELLKPVISESAFKLAPSSQPTSNNISLALTTAARDADHLQVSARAFRAIGRRMLLRRTAAVNAPFNAKILHHALMIEYKGLHQRCDDICFDEEGIAESEA
jgi:hypothetical protein